MVEEEIPKTASRKKRSKNPPMDLEEKIPEKPGKEVKSTKKADKAREIEEEQVVEETKKKMKKGKDSPLEDEVEEPTKTLIPRGKDAISRPIPPALKGTATMLEASGKGIPSKESSTTAVPEKPTKKEKVPFDPAKVKVHDIEIPEELKQYQRGCILKVRKVGNSRFSQEMTRCANQLFIKKLGRGQYFVPDYYILSEIQGWGEKWATTLEYMPIDDAIRQLHMQDVRSKISATGEDLTKKVKDLNHVLKMRDDQLIKVQMTSEERVAQLTAEIENLHSQLDQSEQRIDELQTKMDDAETGTGAAEIEFLKAQTKSLEEERDSNERLYREAQAKIGQLQNEIDSLKQQFAAVGRFPTVVDVVAPLAKPTKPKKSAPTSAAPKPPKKAKPGAKPKPVKGKNKVVEEEIAPDDAAELDGLSDILQDTSDAEVEEPIEEESVDEGELVDEQEPANEEDLVEEEEPTDEEESVDEAELAKAMAYKKPKWDDDDTSVEVKEDENVEMSDEELEEFEREQKQRESEDADEDLDEDPGEDTDEG